MTGTEKMSAAASLFRISLTLPASLSDDQLGRVEIVFSELLESVATSHLRQADQSWLIEALFEFEPDLGRVANLLDPALAALGVTDALPQLTPVEQRDWLAENRAAFPPLRIGRFWVHGSHVEQAPPAGTWPLLVEAAQAFGSGTHPTTEGCLRALQMIATHGQKSPGKILDMGCGSAILAMAARKIWPASSLIAADNDPVAVRVAAANARINGIAPHQIRCVVSTGFAGRAVRQPAPYDLILANILAGPLRRMASSMMPRLAPDGWVVLSGILNEQALAVERTYAVNGARCSAMLRLGDWTTIIMRRTSYGSMPGLWHGRQLMRPVRETGEAT